jgi:hypothetical protein
VVDICNSNQSLHVISVSAGITRLTFLTVPCLEIDILREQLRRFEQGTGSLQRIVKGLGKIATRIYLIYAGGVVGSGCPGPMSFFDVPTRIWKMQGPQSGTAREKTVEKESGQNLWVNF